MGEHMDRVTHPQVHMRLILTQPLASKSNFLRKPDKASARSSPWRRLDH